MPAYSWTLQTWTELELGLDILYNRSNVYETDLAALNL